MDLFKIKNRAFTVKIMLVAVCVLVVCFNFPQTFASKLSFLKEPHNLETVCNLEYCQNTKGANWNMVTLVKSFPGNVKQRKAIRSTWGAYKYVDGGRFDTVFVIGKADGEIQDLVDKEAKAFRDLLQVDLFDHGNSSLIALAGMQWISENLDSGYDYYSSVVDDVVVSVGEVQEIIDKYRTDVENGIVEEFPILCMFETRKSHFHFLDEEEEENKKDSKSTPDFCSEDMFTMTIELARKLWESSQSQAPISSDNYWFTGLLREKIGKPGKIITQVRPPAAVAWGFGEDVPTMTEMRRYMTRQLRTQMYDKPACKCLEDDLNDLFSQYIKENTTEV